jgi:hypothetical protein
MQVVREPVAFTITRITGKRRRVVVNRLISKVDDHRPCNNKTILLDKENNEEEDKSLCPLMTALLKKAKAFILY